MRFAYETIGWRGPLQDTLAAIARLGFEGVEMFDLLDRVEHQEDVAGMLRESGLALSAAYFAGSFVEADRFAAEMADFQRTARAVLQLGGHQIVVGGGRRRRSREAKDTATLIQNLNKLGRAARRAGIELAFHPHWGTLVSSPEEIAFVLAATDPELVKLALDIAHLALCGGNPLEILGRYLDRVVYVHLKDLKEDVFTELGRGELPIVEFCEVIGQRGFQGWAAIELDASEDPVSSGKDNAKYIREHLARFSPAGLPQRA